MTPAEIRKRITEDAATLNERYVTNRVTAENALVIIGIDQLRIQGEIAAQLAELNARMQKAGEKSVFETVFGR